MTEANNQPTSDRLDRAVRALRDVPTPSGPPPHLVASVVEALQMARVSPELIRLNKRRNFMFRLARYGSLATAAAVLVALGLALVVMDRTAGVTFADVIANVKKAKSVTFICKQKLTPKSPVLEQSWFIQGDHYRFELPGQQETLRIDLPVVQAWIMDAREKKGLELNFVKKTAKKLEMDEKMAKAFVNPISQLREFKEKDAKEVGEEELDGVKTKVYELQKIDFLGFRGSPDDGDSIKIWADAKTGLPVKILLQSLDANKKVFMTVSFEKFSWNEELAPEMFKLEVPKGFEIKED
jgi:hypothetical protein